MTFYSNVVNQTLQEIVAKMLKMLVKNLPTYRPNLSLILYLKS